ncbi:Uncharacterised protein [Shigella sonnei]|nr:Uncharacterised protein [Shigella sonnei]
MLSPVGAENCARRQQKSLDKSSLRQLVVA